MFCIFRKKLRAKTILVLRLIRIIDKNIHVHDKSAKAKKRYICVFQVSNPPWFN